jgi:hypothetical protein
MATAFADTPAAASVQRAPAAGSFPASASATPAPWAPPPLQQPRLGERDHPASHLYVQALDAVKDMERRHRLPAGPHSERVAGALVVAAQREGLQRIDRAEPSVDRARVIAVQGDLQDPFRRLASVDTALAANTPLERSSAEALTAQAPVPQPSMPMAAQAVAHAQAR